MILQNHRVQGVVLVTLSVSLLGCAIPQPAPLEPIQGASPRTTPPQHAQVLWSTIDSSRTVRVDVYEVAEPCDAVLGNFVRRGFGLFRFGNGGTAAFAIVKWIGIDVETQMVSCIPIETRGPKGE